MTETNRLANTVNKNTDTRSKNKLHPALWGPKLTWFIIGLIVSTVFGIIFSPVFTKWVCVESRKIVFSGIITDSTKFNVLKGDYLIEVKNGKDACKTNSDGTFNLSTSIKLLDANCSLCSGLSYPDKISVMITVSGKDVPYEDFLLIPAASIEEDTLKGNILTYQALK